MDIVTVLIWAIILLVVVIVGVIVIDKTFTGPASEFTWLAKLVLGVLALVMVIAALRGGLPAIRI